MVKLTPGDAMDMSNGDSWGESDDEVGVSRLSCLTWCSLGPHMYGAIIVGG